MINYNIGVVILAAGSSSRLGQSKQLLKVNGKTLLAHTIQVSREAELNHIVVVLGANADAHKLATEELSVNTVINPSWNAGIGTSIKVGMKALIDQEREHALLLVCDQPMLTSVQLRKILNAKQNIEKGIVASSYANTVGVPALFARGYFDELITLPDTQGAKSIIHRHLYDTSLVDFPEGAFDIDTQEDLNRLLALTGQK